MDFTNPLIKMRGNWILTDRTQKWFKGDALFPQSLPWCHHFSSYKFPQLNFHSPHLPMPMKITTTDFISLKLKRESQLYRRKLTIYIYKTTTKIHVPEMTLGFLAIYSFHFLVLSWAGDGITTLLTLHGNVNKAPT